MDPLPEKTILPTGPAAASAGAALPAGAVQIQVLRTVIVDPVAASAGALAAMVAGRGHEAVCLSAGEALEDLQKSPPDCLILRLNHGTAPEVAEVLRQLRQQPDAAVFVIAVTDGEEPVSRMEAWLKRGVDDFLSDPLLTAGRDQLARRLAVAEHLLLRRRDRERSGRDTVQSVLRYEEVFLRSPDAALVIALRDGLVLEANDAAEQILGVKRQDLRGRYLSLVLPDLFDRDDYDPQTLGATETRRLAEVRHQRPDRTRRWLDVLLKRIPWPPGQAILMKFHDISVLKERESRRLQEARLDAASRVMSGIARDLSDSLTSLRGNLELLQRQPASRAEMQELLSQAWQAGESATALCRRLNTMARAPQGGDLRKRVLDFRALLERTIPFSLLNGKARPVISLSDDLWPVEGDENALTDLIRRLVENADESMPSGGTLFIDAANIREGRQDDCEQASVRVRIRDQGHGIPAGQLARIFDPWFTTRPGRDGMGLAIAAATVKAHNGYFAIESIPETGTTLTFWLPVNIRLLLKPGRNAPALPDSSSAPLSPVVSRPQEVKARILFMDDDAGIRVVVQKILASAGYDIYCTRDGQEAIDAYRKAREFGATFDLVLVDLDVRGGMGGRECIARLKAEFPSLKALLTTGYIDDILMETFREHGFLGVVPKPFQHDRLVQSIGRILGVTGA